MFSQSDIDILRLICWCQFVKPESLSGISTPIGQDNLLSMGLVQFHKKSGAFTLTRTGRSLLQRILPLPDLTKSYHRDAVDRRLRLTNLALTAYKGAVNIFTTAPEELSNSPTLFLSAITKSRGSNPWSITRVAVISQVTGRPPVPYTPPRTQFLTEKGDVVDAPPIRIPGKSGGQTGGKVRPLV